ncbi:MAG: enoyl-CoA hydratase/isomerase family protein [Paracoccaceae bacterium]
MEQFHVEVKDYIAVVTHDHPPVNSHNTTTREELIEVFDELHDRADVRVIILTGRGKYFSGGADLVERPTLDVNPGDYVRHNRRVREYFNAISDCDKPVIAAINGPCVGAGMGLMMACDIMLASDNAFFAMPELDVGIAGGGGFLMRHFTKSRTRAMYFTCRRYPASEMYRLGVVEAVVPQDKLLDEAMSYARDIAKKSPLAVQAAKRVFQTIAEMPLRDAYKYEQTVTVALAKSEDTKEAQKAFLEKREPVFKGR